MKFFKIGLGIVAALILLLVIGGGIFIATFDANHYKSLISEQVQLQTGREFSLGDIKPSVFPWLGVELTQVNLSNANGFKAQQMLRMQRLDVHLELLPLLSQKIHIDTLKVHGLELFLEKDKTGKTNWDDLLQKNAQSETAPAAPVKTIPEIIDDEKTAADPFANLVINGVQLKAANIHWADASTGKNIALQNINLSTGALRAGEDLPLALSSVVELSEPAAKINVNIKTLLKYDLAARQYFFTELVLAVDAQLQQQALSQIQLTFNSELSIDLNQQRFDLPEYALQIDLQGSATQGKKIPVFIEGGVKLDLQKQTAELKPFEVQSQVFDINLELAVEQLLDAPQVGGKFVLEEFNPRELADLLAIDLPKMQNEAALEKAELSFYFGANEKQLNLSSLTLQLDQSTVLGQVQVTHFEQPQIVYSLKMNQLVLDDYLPPPAKTTLSKANKKTPKTGITQKADTPIELPTELLRDLNLNGIFQAVSVVVSKQRVSDLTIKTLARSGVIKLPEISARVLQGKLKASAQLDVRKQIPRYQFKLQGDSLKAESIINPVLQDLLGEKSVSMSGDTNITLDINTQGESKNQLIAGSNGRVKLNMGKAELHGVDAEYFVRKGVIGFLEKNKQSVPQAWRGEYKPKDKTALKVARASAVIKNGVVENKDLLLSASRFNISGAGKINLPEEQLDYRVVVDVNPSKTKTAGERLLDVPMPIFVKGNFAQPDISIDSKVWLKSVGKELKTEVKAELKQKLKKEKDKKIDKLKDKYKDKLKNLFR